MTARLHSLEPGFVDAAPDEASHACPPIGWSRAANPALTSPARNQRQGPQDGKQVDALLRGERK